MKALQITELLKGKAHPEKALHSQRFFKTGKGEYAEGDIFLGVTVPETREIAKKFDSISLFELQKLIESPVHEARLCALILLTKKSKKEPEEAYSFYLKNLKYINNWDLVDTSAEYIIGSYLCKNNFPKNLLLKMAESENIWERRIAIISTFHCIKHGDPNLTLKIATRLIKDEHDLIHKAVGWMLREVGKRCSISAEEEFLEKYAAKMPRTMLRYAIEKFPENKRQWYLKKRSL